MRMSGSGPAGALQACLVSVVCLGLPVLGGAADQASAAGAVWTPKQVHFVFQGFTTHYSCEGLRDQVRKALLELGARKDLKVTEGACSRPGGGPEPFPTVDVRMNVLRPAGAGTGSHEEVVPAHWKPIDLKLDRDPLGQAEDCELIEQIKHTFLPLFASRKVDYQSSCVAHQVMPGGTWLRAEVLVADEEKYTNSARF